MTNVLALVVVSIVWVHTAALPHIVFVLYDDLGYNDASWRAAGPSYDLQDAWPTNTLRSKKGVILGRYYTQELCTPSRAAFMTGRYPIRLGLQHDVPGVYDTIHLPVEEVTLATRLKKIGYRTLGVGKWHLGAHANSVLPTNRGFDEWYGYWHGWLDYWKHTTMWGDSGSCLPNSCFPDLHTNQRLDKNWTLVGTHATYILDEKMKSMLERHASDYEGTPFFLYYAMANPHKPLEVPDWAKDEEPCKNITSSKKRRLYCGLIVMADHAFNNLTTTVSKLFEDHPVLYMVSGDNGAEPSFGGNNLPLKGEKGTMWEGGIRNNAYIYSNSETLIPEDLQGTIYRNIFHITDWYPTILEFIGEEVPGNLDGVSHLSALLNSSVDTPRTDFLVNIDPCNTNHGTVANHTELGYRSGPWKLLINVVDSRYYLLSKSKNSTFINGLYNISADPRESNNLYNDYPIVVKKLTAKMEALHKQAKAPCNCKLWGASYCPTMKKAALAAAKRVGGWAPWMYTTSQLQKYSTSEL